MEQLELIKKEHGNLEVIGSFSGNHGGPSSAEKAEPVVKKVEECNYYGFIYHTERSKPESTRLVVQFT